MFEELQRAKRIIGRIVTRKSLPDFTYRLDTRTPDLIRATGFQPWLTAGTITLVEHVSGAYAAGTPNAGALTKYDSQWVSTGAYQLIKKLDPTFAQQILSTNIYKIDTSVAIATGYFLDANDAFDRAGVPRPFASQKEWIKLGGIPSNSIIKTMPGQVFFNQYDMVNGAPDEAALTGWVDL